jgi:hypothetical protein
MSVVLVSNFKLTGVMNPTFHLYMMMIGCRPEGRFTEQHDIFFGIARHPSELIPQLLEFWPEAKGKMHVDALRAVRYVDGFEILVRPKEEAAGSGQQLFFLNLGGYTREVFDEAHYKMLVVAPEKSEAIRKAKQTAFYKHTGYKEAPSHIDDKYGVDVDDIYEIKEILSPVFKNKFAIEIRPATSETKDEITLGYITFDKLRTL